MSAIRADLWAALAPVVAGWTAATVGPNRDGLVTVLLAVAFVVVSALEHQRHKRAVGQHKRAV